MRKSAAKVAQKNYAKTHKVFRKKEAHEKNDDAVQYKFVYILQETIPRLCVRHKCVKGCGDLRDIYFIRMGLQFASERFF